MPYTSPTVGTIDENTATTSHTLTPGAPSGVAAGNLVLLLLGFRGTPSAEPTVTGFTRLTETSTNRIQLWGRIATGTDDTPSISATLGTSAVAVAQYACFPGAPASMTGIAAATAVADSSTIGPSIPTEALGTPSEDNALIVYAGFSFDDDGPCTTFPNGSSVIGDTNNAVLSTWTVWSYKIQTTAAAAGASEFTATGIGDQNTYSRVIALKAGAGVPATPTMGRCVYILP